MIDLQNWTHWRRSCLASSLRTLFMYSVIMWQPRSAESLRVGMLRQNSSNFLYSPKFDQNWHGTDINSPLNSSKSKMSQESFVTKYATDGLASGHTMSGNFGFPGMTSPHGWLWIALANCSLSSSQRPESQRATVIIWPVTYQSMVVPQCLQ